MGFRSTFADRSSTITTGGTPQTISAADVVREGFTFHNLSSGDLYINIPGTASTTLPGSIKVIAGALYETPPGATPRGAVSVVGATTGQAFTYKEW